MAAMLPCEQPARSEPSGARELHAAFASLREQLAASPFRRPLNLTSAQGENSLRGDVHAVLEHPYADVRAALNRSAPWCDVLILHPTTKQCRASTASSGGRLTVSIARKLDQSPESGHRTEFAFDVQADDVDYLKITLRADEGPLGTHDYDITFAVVPLDAERSFAHLSYSYGFGVTARLVMETYLNTVARDKVGFSVVGRGADGKPVYAAGVRGAIERNVMRYYLAIDAYVGSLGAAAGERSERRLRHWLGATAPHPQLREADEAEYLVIKRREIALQREAGNG